MGYNPWGRKESDTIERLLCVCLCVYWPIRPSILAWRTPLPDREAWQASVYRVAKSQTLQK